MVFNKLGPNYHAKSKQYFYVVRPSQVLQSCLPIDYPNSLDDLNGEEYVCIAPLNSLKDEHVVGSITDEELILYVGELLENICFAHGPNAPIWFTSIGGNKLAAQPREVMQENCVKTPMLHMTGPLGSGKSELYHEIRTTDPQVVVDNKTHIQLDTSPSTCVLNLKLADPRFSHGIDPLDPEYYKDISEIADKSYEGTATEKSGQKVINKKLQRCLRITSTAEFTIQSYDAGTGVSKILAPLADFCTRGMTPIKKWTPSKIPLGPLEDFQQIWINHVDESIWPECKKFILVMFTMSAFNIVLFSVSSP